MPYADPEAQKKYQREWFAARRAAWFADKVCDAPGCEISEDLELDHIDPSIKVSHRIWSWSEERRTAELAKCRPLCSEHHLEKSRTEHVRGERHPQAKLSNHQVAEIRRRHTAGERPVDLQREFVVPKQTYYNIIRKVTRT